MKSDTMKTVLAIGAAVFLTACGSGGNSSESNSGNTNTGTLACTLLATGSIFNPGFNIGLIYQIAVDGSNVYWFDVDASGNSTVLKAVPKNGGSVTVLASGLGGVNDFAMDNTSIYWTEHILSTGDGSIKSVPKTGGAVTVLASGTPAGSLFDVFFPVGIALDNTNVYWGEGSGGGAVRRVPKAGGTVIDINRGQQAIGTLALDSDTAPTTIFYSPGHNAGFFSIPIAGGTPTTLATNVGTNIIKPFIVDSSHLFGVDTSNPGSLFSIPLSGGTPTYLANNLQTPGALATDGTFLYYSNDPNNPPSTGGPSAILKIAKTGGTHSGGLCITDPNNPSGSVYNTNMLAVDANNVYLVGFVNGGAGAGPIGILKAPKP